MKNYFYKYNYFWKKPVNYYMTRNILFNDGYKMIGHGKSRYTGYDNVCYIIFHKEANDSYVKLQANFVPSKEKMNTMVGDKVLSCEAWYNDENDLLR